MAVREWAGLSGDIVRESFEQSSIAQPEVSAAPSRPRRSGLERAGINAAHGPTSMRRAGWTQWGRDAREKGSAHRPEFAGWRRSLRTGRAQQATGDLEV